MMEVTSSLDWKMYVDMGIRLHDRGIDLICSSETHGLSTCYVSVTEHPNTAQLL
jgi:hypothetical protein